MFSVSTKEHSAQEPAATGDYMSASFGADGRLLEPICYPPGPLLVTITETVTGMGTEEEDKGEVVDPPINMLLEENGFADVWYDEN